MFLPLSSFTTSFSALKTGQLLPGKSLTVLSDAKGKISSFSAQIGEIVQSGQPVVQIEDSFYLYSYDVDHSQGVYENLQSEYETQQSTFQQNVVDYQNRLDSLQQQISDLEEKILYFSSLTDVVRIQYQNEALQSLSSLLQELSLSFSFFQDLVPLEERNSFPFWKEYDTFFTHQESIFSASVSY